MKDVRYLKQSNITCEATLASDEMETWQPDTPCKNVATVHITYHNLQALNSCHYHYITRTAFPNRKISEAI